MFQFILGLALAAAFAGPAGQQPDPVPAGTIEATISTQSGTVLLPGVLVVITRLGGDQVAELISDSAGHVSVAGLEAGIYRVRATIDGFDPFERSVTIADRGGQLTIDMSIAAVSERVDVVATAPPILANSPTLASSETMAATQAKWLAPGGNVQQSLHLLPSILATPTGESINGARPYQAGYQIGAATFADPANNLARVWLPVDGVDAVTVLPNPYETEFGRFSSGLISVQTRRASDNWHFAVNNVVPAFRTKRGTVINIIGLGGVKPSLEVGGPLVKGRIFLEETAQYSWFATDVPSRPEDELKTTQWFGSLTRVDAIISPRHSLIVTGGFDDNDIDQATLGTFTPPDATAHITDGLSYAIVTERALVKNATFVESTVHLHQYDARANGQGSAPMTLLPETTLGDFYNQQHRETSTVQWVETLSTSRTGFGGQHLIKVGSDVVSNGYDGQSNSAPVIIARSNGTTARRLDYDGPSTQQVRSVDVALFAQDRVQPSRRWYLEVGARVDRDGVADDFSASPRVGAAILLSSSGSAVLRSGYGLFYERTPSVAGAFRSFDVATDSRFEADGQTLSGPPVVVAQLAGDLHSAHSAVWDVAYDHRLNTRWAFHASVLDRQGDGELIVDSERNAVSARQVLTSGGQSRFLQEELGVHFTRGTRVDVSASYIHATAREDLNALLTFYDTLMSPVVGRNEYAAASADVPNRLFVRGHAMPTPHWSVVGTFDWHSGVPYSVVNEDLDFIGPRNVARFPTYMRTEVGLDRRVTLAHAHPWIGVRVTNALDAFLPVDVQANISSPAFGSFYNSEYRQVRIHVRFER